MTFLDTNVCLDLIAKRSPWHKQAESIVKFHIENSLLMGISILTVPTLFYLIGRHHKSIDTDEALNKVVQIFKLLDVTAKMTTQAIDKSWKDIEDAIQHECAHFYKSDCIITRNKPDFKKSMVPVFTPDEWIRRIGI